MFIVLDKDRVVEDVQDEFNNAYPYLKLQFLKKDRAQLIIANKARQDDGKRATIGDLDSNMQSCKIEVDDLMTVHDLEKAITACINVPVKILRKSGNIWLETSVTNYWTLARQNEHAKEISSARVF